MLTKMRECVGWEQGAGDGIFAPGGAISNLYAVQCARQRAVPDAKQLGLSAMPRLVMFTSEHVRYLFMFQCPCTGTGKWSAVHVCEYFLCIFKAHFSIKRAGAILGIGTDNVICIKTDERFETCSFSMQQFTMLYM